MKPAVGVTGKRPVRILFAWILTITVIVSTSGCAWLTEAIMMNLNQDRSDDPGRHLRKIDNKRMIDELRHREYIRNLETDW